MARRYEGRSDKEIAEMRAFLEEVRDHVVERARIEPDDTVVDVGTGTGLLALGALDHLGADGSVIALDVSVDCLEELRRVCVDPRVSYVVGSADVLPLPDASVDVLLTRSVLIYVPDKAEAAREFFRVLRPEGRVSIFEPINRRATPFWEIVDLGPLRDGVIEDFEREWPEDDPMLDFDEQDLLRMFKKAGFGGVDADVHQHEQAVPVESFLHGISAPGRPSPIERWRAMFSVEEVEQLVAAVRAHGDALSFAIPCLYLAGMKP